MLVPARLATRAGLRRDRLIPSLARPVAVEEDTLEPGQERRADLEDARITAIEHEHPGGIPDSIRPEYARLVAEHNDAVALYNDLVARQRRLNDDYKAQVDRHNARVADANTYAAASGPCSFLPVWLRARICGETD